MKHARRPVLYVSLALGAVATLVVVAAACGFDPPEKNTSDGGGSGTTARCEAPAGQLPAPDCDNSDNICTSPGCPIEPSCGSSTTCLPLSDNKGKTVQDFRIRRLNVAAPAKLAETFVQNTVVTQNIDLKAPECAENGTGAFNWLFRVDRTAGTVRTGGAPPASDFRTNGFCFYNQKLGSLLVQPTDVKVVFEGDTFTTETPIPKLNVPIFLNGNINTVIVLPLTDATINKVSIGDDGNCIGKLDTKALTSDCFDDPSTCAKWKTAGSIGGYITLEEADDVKIDVLSNTLCVLLSGTVKDPATNRCTRPLPKGDYCSTTKSPGGCQDSFWLAATFSASAVKINDGASNPVCQGGNIGTDAGTDARTDSGDAALDARRD